MDRRQFLHLLGTSAAWAAAPRMTFASGGGQPMKALENLTWKPSWVTHLGCLRGCLDFLEMDISSPWLWGGTGHAFVINLHDELCPSGPTAWKTKALHKLGKNLGYGVDAVVGFKQKDDFNDRQKQAWDMVRKAIDEGYPCYGWELEIPEFYVIYGYDDVGYHFKGPGCDDGKGPLAWGKLGDTGIGIVEVYVVKSNTGADSKTVVKATLEFAVDHARSRDAYTWSDYRTGIPAFEQWITALKNNTAGGFGNSYNAAVWAECRHFAARFLEEAREHLGQSVFDEAIVHYGSVAHNLRAVSETFPFLKTSDAEKETHIQDVDRRKRAISCLEAARDAEAAGLRELEKIIPAL